MLRLPETRPGFGNQIPRKVRECITVYFLKAESFSFPEQDSALKFVLLQEAWHLLLLQLPTVYGSA